MKLNIKFYTSIGVVCPRTEGLLLFLVGGSHIIQGIVGKFLFLAGSILFLLHKVIFDALADYDLLGHLVQLLDVLWSTKAGKVRG